MTRAGKPCSGSNAQIDGFFYAGDLEPFVLRARAWTEAKFGYPRVT